MMWLLVHKNTQSACSLFRISTRWLYMLQMLVPGDYTPNAWFCMLQVGVHCAGIICTIAYYGIGIIFWIVIVNMEYYIIVFIVRDSVFQIWTIFAELNSGCFFVVHGEFDWRIFRSLTVCSQLRDGSSTWIRNLKLVLGTWIFNWEPTYLWI